MLGHMSCWSLAWSLCPITTLFIEPDYDGDTYSIYGCDNCSRLGIMWLEQHMQLQLQQYC